MASSEEVKDSNEVAETNNSSKKAETGNRIIAAAIDGLIAGAISVIIPVIGGFIGAAYMLVRDGLDIEFMDNRSLGKKIMKLRPVVMPDGGKVDLNTSVKRNWMFALGPLGSIPIIGWFIILPLAMIISIVEIVLVLTDDQGRRWGDKMAETQVVETGE